MTPRAISVAAVHASVRSLLDRRLRRLALVWTAVAVMVAVVAAWLLAGDAAWSRPTAAPLVVDLLLLAGLAAAGAAWWHLRARHLDEALIAASMERAAGLADGLVRGGLELGRATPRGVSPTLVARAQASLLGRLDAGPDVLAGAAAEWVGRTTRRGWGALVAVGFLVLVLGGGAPTRMADGLRGLAAPVRHLTGPALAPLGVEPGDIEVVRGGTVEVTVSASGRDSVVIHWQSAGDVAHSLTLAVVGGRASHRFEAVTAGIGYRIEAPDGARSADFAITPRDPLFVTDVLVELTFPGHTGRLPEEYRGDVPALSVPVGTRLRIEGRGSRPLSRAALEPVTLDSLGAELPRVGDRVDLTVSGAQFATSWVPRAGGAWAWRFKDAAGGAAELLPRPLALTLVPDGPPQVVFTLPAADTTLPLNLKQPLVLQAADDYGVAWMELVAWRVTALGEVREPVTQRLDLGEARAVVARPLMDVSTWGLVAGDQVRYYARVVDNGPSAQEARTAEYVLRMPDAAEMRREAQARMDDASAELEALADQAGRAADEARDLERQARAPDRAAERRALEPGTEASVGFEEREGLAAAIEEQQAMAARVDSLRRELGAMSEALSEAGAQDDGLRSDLAALQELLEEVGGQEMQERLDALAERMGQMDQPQARQALEELAAQDDAFRERLEEALDRMKRAAAQQDFRATTREAEELAAQERALADALAEDPSEERAAQQDALDADAAAMEERMEALAERLREMGEEQAAAGVEQALEGAQAARQDMQQAAQQARQGQGEQAAQQGQDAADQLDEAAREMMEAQQQMMEERAQAFERALQQTSQDALSLARRQSEIRDAMSGATPQELADLRAAASGVEQGVAQMAENLAAAARASQAGGGERPVAEAMGKAMAALDGVVSALDNPAGRSLSPQASAEQAVDALNQIAMQSLAAAQQLSQGGSSGTSAEQMQEQMEQLAQQQADVNNQASQMMPMQLTPQTMQEQMEQLAQQQQSVASNVGQMANQEGKDGALGDLEAMAREAEALAQALAGGRLDAGTRERQERLFHRLLDAGRSLEKEELSEERESSAAGLVERGEVAPLGADALRILRFRPDADALRRLPPAARTLVIQYFQRLNGEGTSAVPPPPRASGGGGG